MQCNIIKIVNDTLIYMNLLPRKKFKSWKFSSVVSRHWFSSFLMYSVFYKSWSQKKTNKAPSSYTLVFHQWLYQSFSRLAILLVTVLQHHNADNLTQRIVVFLLNSMACHVEGDQKVQVGSFGAIEVTLPVLLIWIKHAWSVHCTQSYLVNTQLSMSRDSQYWLILRGFCV